MNTIPIGKILPNPEQPRIDFDADELVLQAQGVELPPAALCRRRKRG